MESVLYLLIGMFFGILTPTLVITSLPYNWSDRKCIIVGYGGGLLLAIILALCVCYTINFLFFN